MDPVQLVARRGGVSRRSELLGSGVARGALDRALRAGSLYVPARGIVALTSLPEAQREAARLRARLTCVSAIAAAGLPVLPQTRVVHLAVLPHSRAPASSPTIRPHFSVDCGRALAPMPVPVALDHAGRCVGARAHLAMFDAALHAGRVMGTDLATWTASSRDRRDWLLAHADARAESVQESLARIDLHEAGLSAVPQVFLDGVGRVDLWVEGRLAVEIDGHRYHGSDEAFLRDRQRDRAVLRSGVLTARFTAAEVQQARAGGIAAAVAEILSAHRTPGRRAP